MNAIRQLATVTASTKRSPQVSGGKRGARATHLEGVSIVPLMPASRDTLQHPVFEGQAMELWETYAESHQHTDDSVSVTQVPDIRQGDLLTVDSTDYHVKFVGNWPAASGMGAYLQIVVEEFKAVG